MPPDSFQYFQVSKEEFLHIQNRKIVKIFLKKPNEERKNWLIKNFNSSEFYNLIDQLWYFRFNYNETLQTHIKLQYKYYLNGLDLGEFYFQVIHYIIYFNIEKIRDYRTNDFLRNEIL